MILILKNTCADDVSKLCFLVEEGISSCQKQMSPRMWKMKNLEKVLHTFWSAGRLGAWRIALIVDAFEPNVVSYLGIMTPEEVWWAVWYARVFRGDQRPLLDILERINDYGLFVSYALT